MCKLQHVLVILFYEIVSTTLPRNSRETPGVGSSNGLLKNALRARESNTSAEGMCHGKKLKYELSSLSCVLVILLLLL